MDGPCSTTASQLDATNSHGWSLKYANLGTSQATKQTTVCGRQGIRSYMKHKFQKKLYRRGLATVLWSVCVCTNAPVTNSSKLCQISYPLIHSHHIMHAEMTKLDHKSTPTTSTSGPGFGPNMKFNSCQVNIDIMDHRLQSTSPAAVHSVQ
jgi:hypothetical protein